MPAEVKKVEDRLFIGGKWTPAHSTQRIEVVNPYTQEVIGVVADADATDVDKAVRAARQAFDNGPWGKMSAQERAALMNKLADELEKRGGDISATVTGEIGQPKDFSFYVNAVMPPNQLRYYAQLGIDFPYEQERANIDGPGTSIIRHESLGVAAVIVPWNYPQSILSAKIGPALAVGCTVVIKPAGETPLDALLLAEAVEAAGFPEGVINVITGGRETGDELVRHPGVDKVAFTGSTAAGRVIARNCGERLIPVTLELGGKSAAVVLEDADLDVTMNALKAVSFMNAGQTCFLLSRVLVPRSRKQEFLDGLVGVAQSFVLGDPQDPATEMGPLVSERIRSRVRQMVDSAQKDGAEILTGGKDLALGKGNFYQPTIITGVSPDSTIAQDEIFGPVVTVLEYDDIEDAVLIANNSQYGLGGAVFTEDKSLGLDVARAMQTGTVGINGYAPDLSTPFGGYKASGLGREQGPEVLFNFVNTKSINNSIGG